VDFLTVLSLETRSDPATSTDIGHVPDTSEHVAGNHDERGEDDADGPCPAGLEDGSDEAEAEKE
jgi:hypothetical protein